MKENRTMEAAGEEAKILRFLSFRPRSEKEVRDYGKKKKIPEKVVQNFIKKLKRMEYLDDAKFARLWIKDRKKLRSLGGSRIKRELLQKGVDRKIIDETLAKEYSPDDEKAVIKEFIRKKKNAAPEKIVAALLRRGFNYPTVKKILFNDDADFSETVGHEGDN